MAGKLKIAHAGKGAEPRCGTSIGLEALGSLPERSADSLSRGFSAIKQHGAK